MTTTVDYGVLGTVTVHSRRKPWPYDLIIGGTPVILRPQQDSGLMIGRKMQSLQGVAPITYDYSSQPVYAERTYAFRRIRGGYGERVQHAPVPTHYGYAINADLSIGGLQIKGPLFHSVLPATTGPVRWFLDAVLPGFPAPPDYPDGWPPLATFAGAGQYILQRDDDTPTGWGISLDLGSATEWATKAVRFWPAGSGQVDSLFVTTNLGSLWKFDGTTWAKSVQQAYTIAVLRDELWIADGRNTIRNCTADPMVGTNWNAQIIMGDSSQPITNLEALDNNLYIFKSNGVFTLNNDTTSNDLFPSFRQQPLPRNGVNATAWLGRLWFGYGDGYYWMDNTGTLVPTGPNILVENNSEVAGEVIAFAGHASWFGYYALWNGGPSADLTKNDSYLIKHGTWVNPDEANTANYQFFEVPNGALKKWANKKILSLYVSDATRGNSRLYAGFDDGSIEWCKLPRGTPNPAHPDSGCEFTTESSIVYWPLHHAMFQADQKSYRGFSAFGPLIDVDNYVRIEYRVRQQSIEKPPLEQEPWIDVGRRFEFSGQRNELSGNVFGYGIEIRHFMESTTGRTPVLEGIALHEQVRPAFQFEWNWTVNARRYLARRDGVIDRRTPVQIRDAMLRAASSVGTVDIHMPDEGIQAVSIIDYADALAPVTKRFGVEWDISMKGIQFRTYTAYGSWDRVALYDWDTIATYTWDDVLYL